MPMNSQTRKQAIVRRSSRLNGRVSLGSFHMQTTVRRKILNPFTNRMIYADGRTAKRVQKLLAQANAPTQILARRSSRVQNRDSKGSYYINVEIKQKIRNPETGRMCYRSSPTGRRVLYKREVRAVLQDHIPEDILTQVLFRYV